MPAIIIDGKQIAGQIYTELKEDIKKIKDAYNIIPGLAVILIGEDPASVVYVRSKNRMCEKLGIHSEEYRLTSVVSEQDVLSLIDKLKHKSDIHGILMQLPVPVSINPVKIQEAVPVYKDVDGFSPENMGRLILGRPLFVPCTPLGIQELLKRSGIDTVGKNIVVVGRSNIVGKPIAGLLMQKNHDADATITVCHSRTRNLAEHTRKADIIIAAIGRPEFITSDMVSEGAVVIDVGINRVKDSNLPKGYRLCGDVEFSSVSEKAGYITRVPGGVGPMTIAMLMFNTVKAAKIKAGMIN